MREINCSLDQKLTYQNRLTFTLVRGETLHILASLLSYEVATLLIKKKKKKVATLRVTIPYNQRTINNIKTFFLVKQKKITNMLMA